MSDTFHYLVTRAEVLMGREVEYPMTAHIESCLSLLLIAVNKFRAAYGKPMHVTSGYRPGKYNVAAGGASRSCHLTCEAVDFADADGAIYAFCQQNIPLLEQLGIWVEDRTNTPTWCHLQIRACNNRFFLK